MKRSVIIQAMRHSIRRSPTRGKWPGQTRCGIDFHYSREFTDGLSRFANSRHGTATNKGATCLTCVMLDDMLED